MAKSTKRSCHSICKSIFFHFVFLTWIEKPSFSNLSIEPSLSDLLNNLKPVHILVSTTTKLINLFLFLLYLFTFSANQNIYSLILHCIDSTNKLSIMYIFISVTLRVQLKILIFIILLSCLLSNILNTWLFTSIIIFLEPFLFLIGIVVSHNVAWFLSI